MIVSILQLMGFPFGSGTSERRGENPNSARPTGDNRGITRSHEAVTPTEQGQWAGARRAEHAGAAAATGSDQADDRAVSSHRENKSVSSEDTFETDIVDRTELGLICDAMARRTAERALFTTAFLSLTWCAWTPRPAGSPGIGSSGGGATG